MYQLQILISTIIILAGAVLILAYRLYTRKNKSPENQKIKIVKERSFEAYLSDLQESMDELNANIQKRRAIIERSLGVYGR